MHRLTFLPKLFVEHPRDRFENFIRYSIPTEIHRITVVQQSDRSNGRRPVVPLIHAEETRNDDVVNALCEITVLAVSARCRTYRCRQGRVRK